MERLILLDAGGVLVRPYVIERIAAEIAARSDRSEAEVISLYESRLREPVWSGEHDERWFWSQLLGWSALLDDGSWSTFACRSVEVYPHARTVVASLAESGPAWLLSNHCACWLRPALDQAGVSDHLEIKGLLG